MFPAQGIKSAWQTLTFLCTGCRYLVSQPAAAMAEQSSTISRTACLLNCTLSQMSLASASLDADSTSTLQETDIQTANWAMQLAFEVSKGLLKLESVQLDEALSYLREEWCCKLLLGLLRRLPWAEMQQDRELVHEGLVLVPKVLGSLYHMLQLATCVHSSEQAAAYAEMSKRCLS